MQPLSGGIVPGLGGSGMCFAVQRKDIHCSPHVHSPAGAGVLGDGISSEYEREDEQSDAIILSRKGYLQAASHRRYPIAEVSA